MTRLKNRFVSKGLVPRGVAILVVLIVGVMACLSDAAQAQRPAPARREARTPLDEMTRPSREVAESVEPQPAEPDEDAPERQYASLPIDKSLRNQDLMMRQILKTGKFADEAQKQAFDNFYTSYFLARWSAQNDVANLSGRGGYRQELAKHFLAAKSDARNQLNTLVFEFMGKLVEGDFHPAVRVNAMLAIGDLNSVEATGREAAVPLPEAFRYLIAAVENEKLSDALRAAAMVGILRHASAGIEDQEVRKSLTNEMLRLAAADVSEGPTASGRAWIVAQALETLGILGSVGENNAVFNAMLKTVVDSRLPFFARSVAADSMGRLNYSSANGINVAEAAVALGQLVLDASVEELRVVKTPGTSVSRRRMLRSLIAARTAIAGEDETHKGIASMAKEPNQQAFVTGLQTTIQKAIDVLDDKKKEGDDMSPAVETLRKSLETLLQKKP